MSIDDGQTVENPGIIAYTEILVATKEESCTKTILLPDTQLQQLTQWNDTWQTYPRNMCIQQLVEVQAATSPDAVAIVMSELSLTYYELNQRANQLARYLQTLGIGPDVPVGVCLERSIELVVGLLGVLKAGGAYVPLDPTYPSDRLTFMLSDAQIPVFITVQHLSDQLPIRGCHIVNIDTDQVLLAQQDTANLLASATVDNLAYVIYTSGSTGQPK